MRYKILGRSGLRVSELALGTMTFGEDWGWGALNGESQRGETVQDLIYGQTLKQTGNHREFLWQ